MNNCSDSHPKVVVFCSRKDAVSTIFQFLRQSAKTKESVAMYHASLTDDTKKHIYTDFSTPHSTIRCLVATIAFGMVSTL